MSALTALKVRGPFRGGAGHDYHTRSFVREFVRFGIEVELEEFTGWSDPLPGSMQDPFFEELAGPVDSDVQVQFVMPHQVVVAPDVAAVNYTMFEAARIPDAWSSRARECALIVVPTRSSADAWIASGVTEDRVRICPLGVRTGLAECASPPLDLVASSGRRVSTYRHRFLNIGEMIPRKNQLGLLAAWIEATTPADDAVLIVKLNQFRPGLAQLFDADLADRVERSGKSLGDCAPVCFVTTYLNDAQLARLYRSASHYVSLSCGEGWDLPMTEAGAAGLTLVAPRHTAYLDYLCDDTAHLVRSTAEATDAGLDRRLGQVDGSLFGGLRWWRPDHDAAVDILRRLIDDQAPAKSSPQERLTREFSWEVVSRRLLDLLAEVG